MTPTPSAPRQPVLRIREPADIVDAVPYLLGFHPTDSLVLVGMDHGRLVCTMRMDLGDVLTLEPQNITLPHSMSAMADGGARFFYAAIYADPATRPADPDIRLVGARVEILADELGCELAECLLVADGRWWSLWCDDQDCCPPEGHLLAAGSSPFSAEATYAGMTALPDRAALAASLDPVPGRDALLPLIRDCEQEYSAASRPGSGRSGPGEFWRRRATEELLGAAHRGPAQLSDQEVARLGVALQDVGVRDAVWSGLDAGGYDGAYRGEALWRDLARRLPAPYDAPALFLVGWQAWRGGNGALANIAADRTLASDPGYSAARLLISAVSSGVNPRSVPPVGQDPPRRRRSRRSRR